ncbi:hypothetical protein ACQHIV_42195 (plasmid) [Kribbella sp. GL6]|uniref:hypothetical protein n=1 Tax=Kribbella sp. GL6 TaxID=3419765 RepID=UPI003D076716
MTPQQTSPRIGEYETCNATKDGVRCVLRAGHEHEGYSGRDHIGHNPATHLSRIWAAAPAHPKTGDA